jgi:hypothetical protein
MDNSAPNEIRFRLLDLNQASPQADRGPETRKPPGFSEQSRYVTPLVHSPQEVLE